MDLVIPQTHLPFCPVFLRLLAPLPLGYLLPLVNAHLPLVRYCTTPRCYLHTLLPRSHYPCSLLPYAVDSSHPVAARVCILRCLFLPRCYPPRLFDFLPVGLWVLRYTHDPPHYALCLTPYPVTVGSHVVTLTPHLVFSLPATLLRLLRTLQFSLHYDSRLRSGSFTPLYVMPGVSCHGSPHLLPQFSSPVPRL